jgi:hypothetical protein
MLKRSEHNDGEVDYVTNLQRRARTFLADLRTKSPLNIWLIQNMDIHPTNHHELGSPVLLPSTIQVSQFAHQFDTDEQINQDQKREIPWIFLFWSSQNQISYAPGCTFHWRRPKVRAIHQCSEFNDCRRRNDKECYHRVAGLNDQIVPQEEAAYRLLTKHFDSSILNHVDVRKHLDDKRFDLAFEAIDELYCHANSNDLVKAPSEIQNIRMRPSETFIEFYNGFEDALCNHVMLHGRERITSITRRERSSRTTIASKIRRNTCASTSRLSSLIPWRDPTLRKPFLTFASTSLL